MSVLLLGVLVGIDNLAVATGLGMLGLDRRRRLVYAASCFFFEAIAPMVGFILGRQMRATFGPIVEGFAPLFLAVCGLLVLNAAIRRHETPLFIHRSYAIILFPFLLSLDNLMAGAGMGILSSRVLFDGLIIGAISGVTAAVGSAIGASVRVRVASLSTALAGLCLLACAAFLYLVDLS